MKKTLRFRYFLRMVALLLAYYAAYAALLFAFNRYEMTELGHDPDEEFEEFLIIVGLGGAMLPFMLWLAWDISAQMLKPLRRMADTARRVGDGQLKERLVVEKSDDEVTSLATTLNDAFDRYQNVVEGMQQFSANASHQLRTPLAALRGAGEVALQRERSPAEYRETIGDMLEAEQRLTRVVEQLLMMARMEAAEIHRQFQPCMVGEETALVASLMRAPADAKEVALEVRAGSDARVLADAALLRQALANVIDNAIKHTPARGQVTISVQAGPEFVAVSVADSGPGISDEFRNQIFERFRREGSVRYHGSGLGLAIAAQIVRLHGGSIEVASEPGRGATFTLRFPVAYHDRRGSGGLS